MSVATVTTQTELDNALTVDEFARSVPERVSVS